MKDNQHYKKARRRVLVKKAFYIHLAVYASVMLFLWALNFVLSGPFWAIFPTLAWGLGVFIHGLVTLGFGRLGAQWEEKELEKELDRVEDMDLEMKERLELKELQKSKGYRDSDLV